MTSSETPQQSSLFDFPAKLLNIAGLTIMNFKFDLREIVGNLSRRQKIMMGLLGVAGILALVACVGDDGMIMKDSTPTITFLNDIGVGEEMCQGVSIHRLEWGDPVRKTGLIAEVIHQATGFVERVQDGTTIDCTKGISATIIQLLNNGKFSVDVRIADLN